MDNEAILIQWMEECRNGRADIRTETLVAQALQQGLRLRDILASNSGFFLREYAPDLLDITLEGSQPYRSYLQLELSRPGFYDMLPEGMFFQPGQSGEEVLNMAQSSRNGAIREKEIRKFFRPFENEFFYQQVQLEKNEAALLGGWQEGALQEFFRTFWNIPDGLPSATVASLLVLIPYAHKIAGDMELMQDCLRSLLLEEVKLVRRYSEEEPVPAGLGGLELGRDMICGTTFREDYPVLEYVIGPFRNSRVTQYTEGGSHALILETFNRFFAPVEADIIFTVEINRSEADMTLSEESEIVLGYSSVL